jgi:hypothetical protein
LTYLIRRFRGLGVSLVVLALSAGAVFAGAPQLVLTGSHVNPAVDAVQGGDEDASEEPSGSPNTEDASEAPDEDASEAPETGDAAESPDAAETGAPADTHGALVSAAAQMDTPDGFANHGAFVSCVAHMKDASLATIDWTTVTPDSCAANAASANGKAKSDAAKANAADKAAAGKAHGHSADAPGHNRP